MKKVLLFLVLAFSLALVACGSGNDTSSSSGSGNDTSSGAKDLPAADIPDKAGYEKSGYELEANDGPYLISGRFYIYKQEGKIMAFTIHYVAVNGATEDKKYDYNVNYDGSGNPSIAGYKGYASGEEAKAVLQRLENKGFVKHSLELI